MAKIKVDTSGVETEPPAIKPGLHQVKIKECELVEAKTSGEPMLKVIYEIQGGESDGRILFDYIMLANEEMSWKLAAFQDALGIKRKAELDTDKLEGKKLAVRTIVQKSEEYGEQARVRNVLAAKGAASTDEDLGDDDDDDEVDYAELSLKELKDELEAREIEVEGKVTKKKAIEALEEDDEEQEGDDADEDDDDDSSEADDGDDESDEDEDESDDDDEDDEDEDYSEMDLAELRAAAKEAGIKSKGLKKKALIEALEEAADEEDDDDDDDDQDYEEMDLDELKNECKERGLKTAGTKAKLIARLEKDDKTGEDGEPF